MNTLTSKLLILSLSAIMILHGDIVRLSELGKAIHVIVLPDQFTHVEATSADLLKRNLEQVTGATFRIVGEKACDGTDTFISVGRTAKAVALQTQRNIRSSVDGYWYVSENQDIYLGGGNRRGVLNAVCAFLEDCVGVRMFSRRHNVFPRLSTCEIQVDDSFSNPAFPFLRDYLCMTLLEPDVALFNRAESIWTRIDSDLGGRLTHYVPDWQCHSYNLIVPSAELESHPEMFALGKDGKRQISQRCPSSTGFRERSVAYAMQQLRAHPEAHGVFIGMNDNYSRCHCALCESRGMNRAHFDMINLVARRVNEAYPGRKVGTLAYNLTGLPPAGWVPERNVIIWLGTDCVPDYERQKPACQNSAFVKRLNAWKGLAPELHIWDYAVTFHNNFAYDPTLYAMSENLRYYQKNNVKGVMLQGALGSGGEREELRAWVLCKLLWNPDLDVKELIKNYCDSSFAQASGPIKEFYSWIFEYGRNGGNFLGGMGNGTICPNLDLRQRAERTRMEALRLAESDKALKKRVELEMLPAFLQRLDDLNDMIVKTGKDYDRYSHVYDTRKRIVMDIKRIVEEHHIRNYTMTVPFQKLMNMKRTWDYGACPVELKGHDILVPASYSWVQAWIGIKQMKDPSSGVGYSMQLPYSASAYPFRLLSCVYPTIKRGGHISVRARVQAGRGKLLELGYYSAAKGFVIMKTFSAPEMNQKFTWLDGGSYPPDDIDYFYLRNISKSTINLQVDAWRVSQR